MKQTDHLTNEQLRNMFTNQFELVNYAIKLAENFIRSGREPFVLHEPQNLTTQILEIIETGKDKFQNIADEPTLIKEVETAIVSSHANNRIKVEIIEEDTKSEAIEAY